jgi:hypothetical protein
VKSIWSLKSHIYTQSSSFHPNDRQRRRSVEEFQESRRIGEDCVSWLRCWLVGSIEENSSHQRMYCHNYN